MSTSLIPIQRDLYDGFIFDCDGTLADSMPLHYRAWTLTLDHHLGRPSDFTEEQFYRYGGIPARQIIDILNQNFGYNFNSEEIAHKKEDCFVTLLPEVEPIPEVVATLRSLGHGAKVAVATGGLTWIVKDILTHIGLSLGPGCEVQYLVGADQVKNGKPAPDMFLRAAELLQVNPKRCLVFEDAAPGFAAAVAAGMDYVDVRPFRQKLADAARY